ncbi:pseudouridine synthase [Bosea sp. 2YAB26]|uniref:pseudouridine synthase n=1 Tax=Bosea sp. 2YAB26 TaxID=3237478 RepID=UPI003F921638
MSDDNNQKSRGPRKGGGAGGKGGGFGGGDGKGRGPSRGRPPSGGDRPPFRGRSGDDRPRRDAGSEGERPARRFDRPAGQRDGAPRPPREGGERPFRSRTEGERAPFRARSGDDRPSHRTSEGGERPARRFDKPAGRRDDAPRPPREGGERPFRSRTEGERAPFRGRSGDDRPSHRTSEGGERPARRFDKPAGRRDDAPRPPREGGERPFRARSEGERSTSRPPREGAAPRGRSFGDRDAGAPRFDRPRAERHDRPRGDDRVHRPRREDAEPQAPGAVLLPSIEPERIAKVMARAGVASRRDCEAMIAEGRVSVNGKVIESPALDVGPSDVILVDGEPLPARERTRLWLYHKPRGLVTTNHDPEGRPTVFEALPEDLPRVLSIGRLDINTEGLLLLTNDGGLARVLELPETGWLRRYRVRAFGSITQDKLDTLRDGVTIDGISYGPVLARFEREQGSNTWLVVDLREGKNREVKTVLEHLGLAVNRLIRVSFGPFQLGDLPEGEIDEIRSRVIKDQLGEELMAKAGVDFEAPRRDELPAAPKRAPAGEDRPRRREGGEERGARGSGRPVSQDTRSEKPWKRTVWRDEEAEPQRERRSAPRRGADPKEARQAREATGQIERKRDKAIADPKGRRVLVERVSAPAREEAPARPARAERTGPGARGARPQERGASPRGLGDRPQRRPRDEGAGGQDRSDERPWQERAPRGERPERAPREGRERPARPFAERQGDDRPRGRSFGDRPSGGRPSGDRPHGRGAGGKPGGGRPFGGKPGGKGPRPGGGGRGKRD